MIQTLIEGDLRSMSRGRMKRFLVASVGGLIIAGTLNNDALPGQKGSEAAPPGGRQAASTDGDNRRIAIPAPRKLKVSAGQGRALVYVLDKRGERVPDPRPGAGARFLEGERDLRWAVVIGVIDHHRLLASLRGDRRTERPPADLIYRRIDLQRQSLQLGGAWSGWQDLDVRVNLTILDNLPALTGERVSGAFLADPLVDSLPWLTRGAWRDVDVEDFIPPEKRHREDRRSAHISRPQRASSPRLMMRTLDFTVEPGRTYRYRARVVIRNFEAEGRARWRDDRLRSGPWSEATDVITIPAP